MLRFQLNTTENFMHTAYTAGLVDGEGTISLTKCHSTEKFRHPIVSMTNTTFELIDFMHKTYGGTVRKVKIKKANWKQAWVWSCHRTAAIACLEQITPFLLEPKKKRRAEMILGYYRKLTLRNGRYTPEQEEQKLSFEEDFFLL